jgi:hypothetical protein
MKWTPFREQLPSRDDADAEGHIELCDKQGRRRIGEWDWIPPVHPQAVDLWHTNGFTAWRRISASSARKGIAG